MATGVDGAMAWTCTVAQAVSVPPAMKAPTAQAWVSVVSLSGAVQA